MIEIKALLRQRMRQQGLFDKELSCFKIIKKIKCGHPKNAKTPNFNIDKVFL